MVHLLKTYTGNQKLILILIHVARSVRKRRTAVVSNWGVDADKYTSWNMQNRQFAGGHAPNELPQAVQSPTESSDVALYQPAEKHDRSVAVGNEEARQLQERIKNFVGRSNVDFWLRCSTADSSFLELYIQVWKLALFRRIGTRTRGGIWHPSSYAVSSNSSFRAGQI
ncbi:hypothetical protein BU23DRAFT_330027 [Bimuria novae-zelandiae CBS 107.79]|uniref:Uncharacterized protein n=1 Tax=Bimuria novae-zelandiae CBS 107.79 TaxID=1447943 RepID=A0A6A5UPC5_9PLEO|nr:hypothetical protein BU23DRAFT_330027 [Bimuria novae-zelandiae CBS 107.79]